MAEQEVAYRHMERTTPGGAMRDLMWNTNDRPSHEGPPPPPTTRKDPAEMLVQSEVLRRFPRPGAKPTPRVRMASVPWWAAVGVLAAAGATIAAAWMLIAS